MSTFQNDADETQYGFGPPSGFPIPPEGGFEVEREWLALTYADGAIVSASLVEALDPCVLAQSLNLERLLSSGGIGPSSD